MAYLFFPMVSDAIVKQTKPDKLSLKPDVTCENLLRHNNAPQTRRSVTLTFPDLDLNTYYGVACGFQNEDYNIDEIAFDASGYTFQVPEGTYSFRVDYLPCNNAVTPSIYLVKDNVTITEDTTIEFLTTEATHSIKTIPLLPNGEKLVAPLLKRIDGTLDYEYIEPGNIKDGFYEMKIFHEKYGEWSSMLKMYYRTLDPDGIIYFTNPEFLTNITGDEWKIAVYCLAQTETDENVVTTFGRLLNNEVELTTDITGYVNILLPSITKNLSPEDLYSLNVSYGLNNICEGLLYLYNEDPIEEVTINLGNLKEFANYDCTISPGNFYYDEENENELENITAPPLVLNSECSNTLTALSYPYYFGYGSNAFSFESTGYHGINPNTFFSYEVKDLKYVYGSSAPYLLFDPAITTLYDYYSSLDYNFGGYGGEIREGLKNTADIQVIKDGTVVFDAEIAEEEYLTFSEWSEMQFGMPSENIGQYIITFDSDLANECGSKNSTEILFNTSKEDFLPPVITYLTIRDKDGKAAAELETPAGATLSFTAGDFDYTLGEKGFYYSYLAQPEVTVEYAPADSDEFLPLEIKVDAEKFFMPGYGAYFEGAIDEIVRTSPDGYFDIRIKLTDTSGNCMTQNISRAIRINSLTAGIKTIEASYDSDANTILSTPRYYDLNGYEIDSSNLSRGCYIIVTPGEKPRKVII